MQLVLESSMIAQMDLATDLSAEALTVSEATLTVIPVVSALAFCKALTSYSAMYMRQYIRSICAQMKRIP